jgi:antitoxin PrlF
LDLEFADLLGWSFTTEEVSAGVYRVTSRDRFGHRIIIEGLNPDAVLDACRTAAVAINGNTVQARQWTMIETGATPALCCVYSVFIPKQYHWVVGITMAATALTSKGQVTVPRTVRDFLGIDPGSKVTFELTPRGEVVLRPLRAKSGRRSRFAKVRCSATVKMRTDEISALTRGD